MPLVAPVPLVPLADLGRVHFIAVGGAGMSAIAALYADLGVPVTGSDQADSAILAELRGHGVEVWVGHDPSHLGEAETVVVSTAVRESNVELAEARRRGLRVWHRSAALGALMLGKRGVAVTGTHGKTTTSAMIATLLAECGADPSWVVGSPLIGVAGEPSVPSSAEPSEQTAPGASSRAGRGDAFVIEADESDGSFLQYPAEVVVVTNIEADHLDNWGTAEAYAEGFAELVRRPGVRTVVLGADDPGTRRLAEAARAAGRQVLLVGQAADADVRVEAPVLAGSGGRALLRAPGDEGSLELQVPGLYNLLNAALAYTAGRVLGVDGAALRAAASSFRGTQRRFQPVAEAAGVTVVDDYAHHPTEVAATLSAARVRAGGHRVIACFQPHLFTRTRDFAEEFGQALALADVVLVLGIYAAREDPIPGVTGRLIAAARGLAGREVHYVEAREEAATVLAGLVAEGDLVVTMGAGDVTKVGPELVRLLGGAGR